MKRHSRRNRQQFSTAGAEVLEERRLPSSIALGSVLIISEDSDQADSTGGRLAHVIDFKGDAGFDGDSALPEVESAR